MDSTVAIAAATVALAVLAAATGAQTMERYAQLLDDYVSSSGVDYRGIAASGQMPAILDGIAAADLSGLDRNERLAFLINAYNALVIDALARGRRFDSLLGRWRFFKRQEVTVAGRTMSLHDLEREWISALGEPRAHFALACAAVSCPRLRSRPYTAAKLDEQLDEQALEFVNDPTLNRFEPAEKRATISKLFRWHRRDFGADEAALLALLGFYHRDPAIAADLNGGEYAVDYMRFDWSLADVASGPLPDDD